MSATAPHLPAEHAPHAGCWMAWPHLAAEWPDLEAARAEHLALVRAIAETERVDLLVHPDHEVPDAGSNVDIHRMPYGDAWTRDTLPVMAERGGEPVALVFDFDGWGGKYRMEGDLDLAPRVAEAFGLESRRFDFVFEGGGIEVDGEGTVLTTEPWLRRLAQRAGATVAETKATVAEALGAEKLLAVEAMLANDHTDGHVDTLVRFVRPGAVVTMGLTPGDPNGAMLLALQEQLAALTDAAGRTLEVHTIPAPGLLESAEGELLPASYANYYLANDQVLVPTYGVAADDEAVAALRALFPKRRVRGLSARAIIAGGGAFHCVTQQRPA
jgi:agmatine deiminase